MSVKAGDAFIELGLRDEKMKQGMKRSGAAFSSFAGNLAAQAAMMGLKAAANFGKAMFSEFANQEQAEARVSATLSVLGQNVEQQLPRFKALADEIQNLTAVGDDEVLNLQALLSTMGVAPAKMEQAAKGAVGLSHAFGMDLNAAAKGVALALEGDTQMLQRYIPALKTAETQTEKTAIVTKAMADGFKIAAESSGTTSTQLKQVKNRLGDMGEEIIKAATGGDGFGEMLRGIADWIAKITPKVAAFAKVMSAVLSPILLALKSVFSSVFGSISGVMTSVFGGIKKVAEGMAKTLAWLINKVSMAAAIMGKVLTLQWGEVGDVSAQFDSKLAESMQNISEAFSGAAEEKKASDDKFIQGEQEKVAAVAETSEADKRALQTTGLQQAIQAQRESTSSGSSTMGGGNAGLIKKIGEQIAEQKKANENLTELVRLTGDSGGVFA